MHMHMQVLHEVHGRATIMTTTVHVQAKREIVELAAVELVPDLTTTAC